MNVTCFVCFMSESAEEIGGFLGGPREAAKRLTWNGQTFSKRTTCILPTRDVPSFPERDPQSVCSALDGAPLYDALAVSRRSRRTRNRLK